MMTPKWPLKQDPAERPADGPLTKLSIGEGVRQSAKPVSIWNQSYDEAVRMAKDSADGARAFADKFAGK